MIRLKKLLVEQLGGRDAVFKQADADLYGVVSPFNAKTVAKMIYDSKGYFKDDEELTKNAIVKNIKNVSQYKQVNTELQKLTSGRGIGEYLQSFLNNVDRMEIVTYLIGVIPKEQWNWTIKKIMPYEDFTNIIKKNPSLWDKWTGKSPNTPISKSDLILLQMYAPEYNAKYKMSFWDGVIDTFLPGTPVADGRKLLSKFDSIIKRRIDYNRNNNLPIETLTQEERSFRQTLFNATPPAAAPYPDYFGFIKLVQDIKQGKNIQPNEFKKYKKNNTDRSDSDLRKNTESGDELKKMWLGLDDPDGANKGYWITSEFKPTDSSNSNAIYYRPKDIPKLTAQQFDELYNAIMKTKLPNGKFPGGNSDLIYKEKLKYVPTSFLNDIEADLGEFKFGAAVENGRKFISVYDKWDLMPPKLNQFNIDVNKYGKTHEIFYRIVQP